jgi:hypothetical protein
VNISCRHGITSAALVLATFLGMAPPAAGALTNQTIAFAPLSAQMYGVAPFAVTASASSGLPVSIASTTKAVCTISANLVTVLAAGSCTLQASQPGNATYAAAPKVNRSFAVAKADQTIAFAALDNRLVTAPPFPVAATASSGLPVTVTSLAVAVCRINAGTVTLVAAGTCTIRAAQAGNAAYAAATPVERSFAVSGAAAATLQYTYDGVGNLIRIQRAP